MNNELKIRNVKDEQWFWVDNDFMNRYRGYFRPTCIAVYASLCLRANSETQTCYPSEEVIALDAGTTSRTVQKYISLLEELRIISVIVNQGEFGRWSNNVYRLLNKKHWKRPEETVSYGNDKYRLFIHPEEKKNKIHRKQLPTNKTNNNNKETVNAIEKKELYKNINKFRNKYKSKGNDP